MHLNITPEAINIDKDTFQESKNLTLTNPSEISSRDGSEADDLDYKALGIDNEFGLDDSNIEYTLTRALNRRVGLEEEIREEVVRVSAQLIDSEIDHMIGEMLKSYHSSPVDEFNISSEFNCEDGKKAERRLSRKITKIMKGDPYIISLRKKYFLIISKYTIACIV